MKILFALLMSLFLFQCSSSKISELYQIYNQEDYIYWSETRKLIWNDFQGEPLGTTNNYGSEIHLYNPSSIEKANLFSSAKLTSVCVFDKRHSWINKNFANDTLLLYNQVLFDIYEVYTRTLRKTFNETDFGFDDYTEKFHMMTENINNDLKNRVERFRKESNLGQNANVIFKWANDIENELEELNVYKQDY